MHQIYELKNKLCKELEKYAMKDTMSPADVQMIDTLAHSVKNLCKIIECEEEESYSMAGGYSMGNNRMPMNTPYYNSYAGRRRNAMGQYSRADNDYRMSIQELMQNAPNDSVRQALQNAMNNMQ